MPEILNGVIDSSNLVAQTFGVWRVIAQIDESNRHRHPSGDLWLCRCKCGVLIPIREKRLVHRTPPSCGCHLLRWADESLDYKRIDKHRENKTRTAWGVYRDNVFSHGNLTGTIVGMLHVGRLVGGDQFHPHNPAYNCRCDCGKWVWRKWSDLQWRNRQACSRGCLWTLRMIRRKPDAAPTLLCKFLVKNGIPRMFYKRRLLFRHESPQEIKAYWKQLSRRDAKREGMITG